MQFGSSLTFRGITRCVFKRLRKRAAQNGIQVASQAGEAQTGGVTIQWKYDPSAQLLEVGCVCAPFWIDAMRVNKMLTEGIEDALERRDAA